MNFPDELKQLKRWCIWRYEQRGDQKVTKVPLNAKFNTYAKSNDENTWCDYETAIKAKDKFNADGLGFFFKPPYIGIDIDDVEEDIERLQRGEIMDNMVASIYESAKSYGEISPSGTGIHIILKGDIPGDRRRHGNVEMYSNGRFFTMTGDSLGKYSKVNRPNKKALERIYETYIGKSKDNVVKMPRQNHGVTHDLTETEIVHKMLQSEKQGELVRDLMSGEWEKHYPSQSEADMAFANILAFYCAKDFSKMDSIFRESGLMRDKWDEKHGKTTYGEATLYKAINDTNQMYTPPNREAPKKYEINFGGTKEKPKEMPTRSYDDTGNAQRFLDHFGELVRYDHMSKKFYIYDGTVWHEDRKGEIRMLVDAVIENIKHEKVIVMPEVDEEEAVEARNKHIKKSRSNHYKNNLISELKHHVPVLPEEFDRHDMLLNTETGYLDLTSGEMKEHERELMFSMITDCEYTTKSRPDTWLDFLDDIFDGDEELIHFIHKAVGYSLTGSTKEEMMFILLGSGRNGKSLFINTIGAILGDYTANMQADSLMVKKYGSGINNDIARLHSARFVTSSEPNEGFVFDEGLIKQMTGEDKITARFLRQENFEFEAHFKIWLATNHKPVIRGTDDGIWRRLAVIPFDVQIPEHRVDKDLKHKLMREAPAILDWALEGCLLWQQEGLKLPDKIVKANEAYREEMDVTDQFVEDACITGDEYEIQASVFYQKYKKWCEDNSEYDIGKIKFGKRMKKKFEHGKSNGVIVYKGVAFSPMYHINFK